MIDPKNTTTSVPAVVSIDDIKWRVAECLRKAVAAGDRASARKALALAREMVEELKLRSNEGKYDPTYVTALVKAIEKVEAQKWASPTGETDGAA